MKTVLVVGALALLCAQASCAPSASSASSARAVRPTAQGRAPLRIAVGVTGRVASARDSNGVVWEREFPFSIQGARAIESGHSVVWGSSINPPKAAVAFVDELGGVTAKYYEPQSNCNDPHLPMMPRYSDALRPAGQDLVVMLAKECTRNDIRTTLTSYRVSSGRLLGRLDAENVPGLLRFAAAVDGAPVVVCQLIRLPFGEDPGGTTFLALDEAMATLWRRDVPGRSWDCCILAKDASFEIATGGSAQEYVVDRSSDSWNVRPK